ncbi:ArsR/SmtB family transcription factor [Orrella daihaiensis]|uniref:Helix-turn-helix transcriptional regulator n=1 Tax=Orrella daihaiensis TaxID=2782176 RepID=A0ABY4ALD2_9BURK|nr:metalloregulator ArsR/SmtB family transcription factor [Orrella daihaiensis]UOD50456.1 helix-turn-helix transcriptional regulator [Orrella daihaiensis]
MQTQTESVSTEQAAAMLAAIGHPVRLRLFRELVQAGPNGLPAGEMARLLDMPPSSLNFHLRALQQSGLVTSRTQGRFVIYTALFDAMSELLGFLTDNCCGGNPCMPNATSTPRCTSKPKSETS